jgi:hypothetical protein
MAARGVGRPDTPAACHAWDGRAKPRGLLGWGGAVRHRRLLGHLAGRPDEPPEGCHRPSPVRVCPFPLADDPAPTPASWSLQACPARLCEAHGQRPLLLPPGRPRLAHRPRARASVLRPTPGSWPNPRVRFQDAVLSATRPCPPASPRAIHAALAPGGAGLSRGWPSRRPIRSGRPSRRTPRLRRPCGRSASPSWLGPEVGRGGDTPCARADRRRLGPLQGEGRRRRLEPGRRESLDVQGVEGDGANAALELRGQQRIKPLTEAVIVQPGEPPRVSTRAPTLERAGWPASIARSRASTPRPYDRTWAGGAGQQVAMSAAPGSVRITPSPNGKWATGLL